MKMIDFYIVLEFSLILNHYDLPFDGLSVTLLPGVVIANLPFPR